MTGVGKSVDRVCRRVLIGVTRVLIGYVQGC